MKLSGGLVCACLLLFGCSDDDNDNTGKLGGPCGSGNSCDTGLVCNTSTNKCETAQNPDQGPNPDMKVTDAPVKDMGTDASEDYCANVSCGSHGTCENDTTAKKAVCKCDTGHHATGLYCVPDSYTTWIGTEPHLKLKGKIDGQDIDYEIKGAAAVALGGDLRGRRIYLAPAGPADDAGTTTFQEDKAIIRILRCELRDAAEVAKAYPKTGASVSKLRIELRQHDFFPDAVDTKVPVVAGDLTTEDKVWTTDETTTFLKFRVDDPVQDYAVGGEFVLKHFSDRPTSGSKVIPDDTGAIGGVFWVEWKNTGEWLEGSFTANVDKSEVEPVDCTSYNGPASLKSTFCP